MDREKMKKLNLTPIEDLIEEDFGKEGTPSRLEFENGCDAFILGERLKEERQKAGLTQEQLATRIGTKKAYISRVENGHTDVQVSTLFKIFEGLGRRISINILQIVNNIGKVYHHNNLDVSHLIVAPDNGKIVHITPYLQQTKKNPSLKF